MLQWMKTYIFNAYEIFIENQIVFMIKILNQGTRM